MIDLQKWREKNNIANLNLLTCEQEEFIKICNEYFASTISGNLKSHHQFCNRHLIEGVETSRYSVEINYRTTSQEALEGYAKLVLGYVSAALKNFGYHTKHVFDHKPLRLLVSTRNWDDGEWAGVITWNHDHNCFVISKGFYNKNRKTVSIQSSKKCGGDSASEIAKELNNMMHHLKDQPDKHLPKTKPVPLKRGPKR